MSILFPIFIVCVGMCKNNFWKKIFQDLSRGETPTSVIVDTDYICLEDKCIYYKDMAPNILFEKVTQLLKPLHKDIIPMSSVPDTKVSWSSIRKKKTKEIHIINYVIKHGGKKNMSMSEKRRWLNSIYIDIISGRIQQDHIIFEDGEIKDILMPTKHIKKTSSQGRGKEVSLIHKWNLYVKRNAKNILYTKP